MNDSISFYLNEALNFIASPWIVVALLLGAIVVYLVLTVRSTRWWVISMLLYSTTFGISGAVAGSAEAAAQDENGVVRLAFPLSILQGNARSLTVLCLAVLLLPTLTENRGRRLSFFSMGFIAYFLLEMWIVVRLMYSGMATTRAVLDLIAFSLMLATLATGVGRWLQEPRDVRALLKSFFGFAALFIAGNFYELIMSPQTAFQSRLSGTTPNAQLVGQACAYAIIPVMFLAQDKLTSRNWRVWSVVVAGLLILLLLWSGSRTSMAMLGIGVVCLFGLRQYRIILPAVGLLLVLWIASFLFPQAFSGIERFLDTSNDRSAAWQLMIDAFYANPVLGQPASGGGYGESFFLATLAFYGLIGAVPLALMMLMITASLAGILRHRRQLLSQASLVNLLIAQFAMLTVSAVFEASLLGSLNIATMVIYLDFALLAYVRDQIRLNHGYQGQLAADSDQHLAYPYLESDTMPDLLTQ